MPSLIDTLSYPKPPEFIRIEDIGDVLTFQNTVIDQFTNIARYEQVRKESLVDIIQNDDIENLNVDKLVAGTIAVDQIYVGSTEFELDGLLTQLRIKDAQGTPVTRVEIGKFGTGADYGIKVRNDAGTVVFQAASTTFLDGIVITDGTVTVPKLSVSQLSAITADMGALTAGTITGGLIRTGTGNPRIELTTTALTGYNSGGTAIFDLQTGGTVRFGDSGADNFLFSGGVISITGDVVGSSNIQTNAVTATKINVSSLSAIAANMGTLTAGTITGAIVRTAASGARVVFDSLGIEGFNSGGTKTFDFNTDGTARIGPSTDDNIFWNGSALSVTGSIIANGNLVGGITNDKINDMSFSKLTAGTITTSGVAKFSGGADIEMRASGSDFNYIKFKNSSGSDRGLINLNSSNFKISTISTPLQFTGKVGSGVGLALSGGGGAGNQLKLSAGSAVILASHSEPDGDNIRHIGTASKRLSDIRSVLINGADISFDNGYYFTEALQINPNQTMEGLYLCNNQREPIMFIDENGNLHVKGNMFTSDNIFTKGKDTRQLDEVGKIKVRNIDEYEARRQIMIDKEAILEASLQ